MSYILWFTVTLSPFCLIKALTRVPSATVQATDYEQSIWASEQRGSSVRNRQFSLPQVKWNELVCILCLQGSIQVCNPCILLLELMRCPRRHCSSLPPLGSPLRSSSPSLSSLSSHSSSPCPLSGMVAERKKLFEQWQFTSLPAESYFQILQINE